MAPPGERLLTAEEFLAKPHDGRRSELVRGRVVEMPPTNFIQGIICINIGAFLSSYVRHRDLGWVTGNDSGVITKRDPDSVRGPDVAFFSYQRVPKDSPPAGYPEVAPELVSK
jgi:Uma2 family endonuclease